MKTKQIITKDYHGKNYIYDDFYRWYNDYTNCKVTNKTE